MTSAGPRRRAVGGGSTDPGGGAAARWAPTCWTMAATP